MNRSFNWSSLKKCKLKGFLRRHGKALIHLLNLFLLFSIIIPSGVLASGMASIANETYPGQETGDSRLPSLDSKLTIPVFRLSTPDSRLQTSDSRLPTASISWTSDPLQNTPVSTAAFDQLSPQIVSDGSGGAIITWQNYRGVTNWDIYAQRLNALGTPQWTANGVAVSTAAKEQSNPQLASDGSGGAIITWQDRRNAGSGGQFDPGYDIYAQEINAYGTPQWTANGVAISTFIQDQQHPKIIFDGSGGAIIAWEDFFNRGIYAQRLNASGTPQWTANGVQVSYNGNFQYLPQIVSDGSGGAIITWYEYHFGTYDDIYAQRLNASGIPQWTANGIAISSYSQEQINPQIVSDGSGGAIITWQDYRNGANWDIYAQKLNGSGAPQWTANGAAVSTAADGQNGPQIVSDGSGGAIITWQDWRNGASDIYAQRLYASSGNPQWTADGVPVSTAASYQVYPQIVSDGSGGAIITWSDYRSGSNYDIYSQRLNASGSPQWTANGVAISTAINDQGVPQIVSDVQGGAIIAWQDNRNGSEYDIYAQKINSSGSLGDLPPDTTPPPVPTGLTKVSPDNNPLPAFKWNASTSTWSSIAAYEVRMDATATWINIGNKLTYVHPTVLSQGSHAFYVRARDGAGNNGTEASLNFNVSVVADLANTRIAFDSNRGGPYRVYEMNADGSGQPWLISNSDIDGDAAWSPDGVKIAFNSDRDGNIEIYVMNADGTGQTRLTNNSAEDMAAAWSPDGMKIAFGSNRDGNTEIYMMNADGTGQTRLTNNTAQEWGAVWSPDGMKIAFVSDRDGNYEIYVMNANGSGQTRLTSNNVKETQPVWSPDGSKIAFVSERDGNYEIYVMNIDGTGQTRLTNNTAVDEFPTWSPDGSKIAFASVRDGNYEIYVMNLDGLAQTRLTNNAATDWNPAWSPFLSQADTTPPPVPTPLYPSNGYTVSTTTPTFIWTAVVDTPSSPPVFYDFRIATNSSMALSLINKTNLATNTYTLTGAEALASGTYWWQVRARDSATPAYNYSNWSSPAWSFNISVSDTTPPPVPSLVSPFDGSTLSLITSTIFTWSAVADTTPPVLYDLQVASNNSMVSPLINKTNLATNTYSLLASEALATGTWYWQVRARDSATPAWNYSAWSSPAWSFYVVSGLVFPISITASFIAEDSSVRKDFVIAEANNSSTISSSDPADAPDPPDPPSAPFMDVQFGTGGTALSVDSRPLSGIPASATWDLRIKPASDVLSSSVVTLTWNASAVPFLYNLALDDTANGGPIINLRVSPYYSYTANTNLFRSMKLSVQQDRPPVVNVLYPSGGVVAGIVNATAQASDPDAAAPYNDFIASITFQYASAPYSAWYSIGSIALTSGTSSSGVWSAAWNTLSVPEGSGYKVRAIASDIPGAATSSDSSTFNIVHKIFTSVTWAAGWNMFSYPFQPDPKYQQRPARRQYISSLCLPLQSHHWNL